MSTDIGPLDWRIAIVDKGGRPTPEFQRRWNAQRNNNALIGTISFGSGAPTGTPEDGAEYADISTSPFTLYIGNGGGWHQVGAMNFLQLADAPHSYSGQGGNILRVNSGATGIEFKTLSQLLDTISSTQGTILYRSATGWTALAPGTSGQFLKTLGAGANPVWATGGGGGGGTFFAAGLPALASFSTDNSTFVTWSETTNKTISFIMNGTQGGLAMKYMAAPTPPYRLVVASSGIITGGSTPGHGIAWRDSATGKISAFYQIFVSGDVLRVENWNTSGSFNGNPFSISDLLSRGRMILMGLQDDGTNYFFQISSDGATWQTVFSGTKASGFLGSSGYNQIGMVVSMGNAAAGQLAGSYYLWDTAGLSRTPDNPWG